MSSVYDSIKKFNRSKQELLKGMWWFVEEAWCGNEGVNGAYGVEEERMDDVVWKEK